MATIYALRDKFVPDENRYIGMTLQRPSQRKAEHLYNARVGRGNKELGAWILCVLEKGGRIEVQVLETCEEGSLELEAQVIQEKLSQGHRLLNRRHVDC